MSPAYGLRPAVHEAADRLREAGHEVVAVPDLYDGRVVDTVEDAATEIPVQLHVAEPDLPPCPPSGRRGPETEDWLNAWYLRMRRAGADVEVHRYHGAGHLFTDPGLPDHDAEAAERAWRVALAFLAEFP